MLLWPIIRHSTFLCQSFHPSLPSALCNCWAVSKRTLRTCVLAGVLLRIETATDAAVVSLSQVATLIPNPISMVVPYSNCNLTPVVALREASKDDIVIVEPVIDDQLKAAIMMIQKGLDFIQTPSENGSGLIEFVLPVDLVHDHPELPCRLGICSRILVSPGWSLTGLLVPEPFAVLWIVSGHNICSNTGNKADRIVWSILWIPSKSAIVQVLLWV